MSHAHEQRLCWWQPKSTPATPAPGSLDQASLDQATIGVAASMATPGGVESSDPFALAEEFLPSAVSDDEQAVAMKKINDQLPEMGRHLNASIKTGTFCSYPPEH